MSKDHLNTSKFSGVLFTALATVLLGGGAFGCFITAFGISYGPGNWNLGNIAGGFLKTAGDVADALGPAEYILLPRYAEAGEESGAFLTLMLAASIVLAFLVVKSRNLWLYALYFIPMAVAAVLSVSPAAAPAVCICISLMITAVLKNMEGRISFSSPMIPLFIGLCVLALSMAPLSEDIFKKSRGLELLSADAREKIDDARYGTNPLGDGNLKQDLRKDSKGSGSVALKIAMDDPRAMYLRGFVGEYYSEGRWHELGNKVHYESGDLLRALRNKDLDPLGQITAAAGTSGMELRESDVTVDIENASSKYMYLPYEFVGSLPKKGKDHSGSFVTAGGLRGASSYSFKTTEDLAGQWTDVAGKLFSGNYTGDIESLAVAESHYNVFCYENYTHLSDGDMAMLLKAIGTRGNQEKGHVGYKTAISKVKSFFDNNVIYTDRADPSENPVKELLEKNKGNDASYASAATLMFRYYGIPARYVEGYLVTKEDAENMKPDVPKGITGDAEHAWTEIYIDGVGFVPIEICSRYYGVMPEADLNKGLESKNTNNPFEMPENINAVDPVEEEDAPEKNPIPWAKVILGILLFLQGVLLLWLLYLAGRKILREVRRRRAFGQKDPRLAICAIYGYAAEDGIILSKPALDLGIEAAYSGHSFSEEHRDYMKKAYDKARKNKG